MERLSVPDAIIGAFVMSSRKLADKPLNTQVRWADLEPWLQQLFEQYGVLVDIEVLLQGLPQGLKPAVRVTGYTVAIGGKKTERFSDWRVFSLSSIGEVEKYALHIVSQALLVLDNEAWRAEQSQSSFWSK
jgi:hypothetical protein